jgi:hypothetical protein
VTPAGTVFRSTLANKAAVLGLALLLCGCGLKSETALRRQFADNKAVIAKILDMQQHDPKVVRIAPTFTRLESDWRWPRKNIGFSPERWSRYRALFQEAGITDGIQKDGDEIFYFVSSQGLSVNGATRGFVYTESPPRHLVERFDACSRREAVCYLALDKNWYLYQWTE